jgi:hypothetical protein
MPTTCPPRRWLHRSLNPSYFPLSTSYPPCRSLCRLFRSLLEVLPAAPLSESLVSFSCRRLARRAAHYSTCFVLCWRSYPPRRSRNRSILSHTDVLPAAPLAASLVSFTCPPLASRAARCFSCFFLLSLSCQPRRSLNRLFPSLADDLSAAPLAALAVSFTSRGVSRGAAHCIARSFLLLSSCAPRWSLHRSFLSLADVLPATPPGA